MLAERKGWLEEGKLKRQDREPYTTPKLTVHGTVRDITQGAGTSVPDAMVGAYSPAV